MRRLQPELAAEGFPTGRDRIDRLRKDLKIRCRQKRKFKATTNSNHGLPVADNLLKQTFSPTAPNQVWVTDISVPQQAAQEMRVWPLAIGLQEQVANHHERLGSKAPVVSVMEKASRRRQVWIKEDEQP